MNDINSLEVGKIIEEFNSITKGNDGDSFISLIRVSNTLKLQITGTVSDVSMGALLEKLQPLSRSEKITRFAVDLSRCTTVPSPVVGFLAFFMMQFQRGGGSNYVIRPSESLIKMFRVMRVDAIYQITDTFDDVLQASKK